MRGAKGRFKVVKGLKYLSSDGSPVALGSTGAHEVWVKQVNPHRGPTLPAEIPLAGRRVY